MLMPKRPERRGLRKGAQRHECSRLESAMMSYVRQARPKPLAMAWVTRIFGGISPNLCTIRPSHSLRVYSASTWLDSLACSRYLDTTQHIRLVPFSIACLGVGSRILI